MQGFIKPRFISSQIFLLGIALAISACTAPASVEAPGAGPVPDTVQTIIFETAAAAQTQTAQSVPPTHTLTSTSTPSKTPTQTPTPTATVLFLLPTNTQVVLPTLTKVLISGGGSGSSKPTRTPNPNEHDYTGTLRCALVGQDPPDGEVYRPRQKFTMVWTVKNTGTAAWRKHIIDYRYIGGDKFHDKARYDMNFIVDPGETIDMEVEMHAPKEPGSYETVWVVGLNTGGMCKMTISIVVK
jgi:hypothetical protein